MLSKGYAVDAEGVVSLVQYKYFTNLIEMPIVAIVFLVGVLLVLFGIIASIVKKSFKAGIWYAGIGTILTVTMLLLLAGYNGTSYYPSSTDLQSSLTIQNSSSSEFTLKAMSIVSLLIPFVLAYIFFAWRSLEKKRTDIDDINNDSHAY
jgi:cytochrome d ubiquinol oxidase subunit II